MWISGNKYCVSFWYVCWGAKGQSYNLDLYKTLNGLARWFANPADRDVPVHRVGRMEINGDGPVEKDLWRSREEFIEYAKPLVGFKLE